MKQKLIDEKGNISLFFSLLFPVTVLLLFILFSDTQTNKLELDFIRKCENELDLTLASYNRQLWHDFGLWGTDTEKVNSMSDELNALYLSDEKYTESTIKADRYLNDNEELKKQITRHMSIRAPILIMDNHLRNTEAYSQIIENISSMKEKLNFDNDNLETILENKDEYIHEIEQSEPPEEESGSEEEISETEIKELQDAGFAIVEDLLEDAADSIIPIYESTGSVGADQPLATNSVQNIFSSFDIMLGNYQIPLIDRIQVSEYLFRYYTLECSSIEKNGEMMVLTTPDGRHCSELINSGRKNEIEQIIFRKESPEKGLQSAKGTMSALRYCYHLVHRMTDSVHQAAYTSSATSISTTIATVSLGTVIIPPTIIKMILILIDAGIETNKDINALLDGKSISFEIGNISINLNYYDLLYALSFFQSESNLLSGMTTIRSKLIPGQFAVAFQLDATFENKTFHLQREFSDNIISKN